MLLEISHEIDYANWLFGPFADVSTTIGQVSNLELDVEDCANLMVRTEAGALGTIHLDMLRRRPQRRLEITGALGSLTLDLLATTLILESADGVDVLVDDREWDRNAMYLAELQHFFDCLALGTAPIPTLDEAIDVLRIVSLARSLQTGENVTHSHA